MNENDTNIAPLPRYALVAGERAGLRILAFDFLKLPVSVLDSFFAQIIKRDRHSRPFPV